MKRYNGLQKGQKKVRMGAQAFVFLNKAWVLTGNLFYTRLEAERYIKRHYGKDVKFKTQTLRFNCVPLSGGASG